MFKAISTLGRKVVDVRKCLAVFQSQFDNLTKYQHFLPCE